MKKLLSLLLALTMCASLAACGGESDSEVDDSNVSVGGSVSGADVSDGPTDAQLKALTDAYNQVSEVYNNAVVKAQENGWTADEQTVSALSTIGDSLEPIGLALNGDMDSLKGSDFDALPAAVLKSLPEAQALLEKVSKPFEAGGETVVTDEALKPLANAYNEAAKIYNEVYAAAEANGWLADEQTSTELDAVYGVITYIGSGLSDDPAKLKDADLDGLTGKLQEFIPAMQEIGKRVSVPYPEG